ncbi:MAG TPA: L,D-transpeptidase [bacterium]|nr:L,D-transpeptidase [bacterium]
MRWTAFLLLGALFLPSIVSAESFYAREAKAERLSWMPFLPHEAIEAAFSDPTGEDVEENSDYRITINLPARRLFLYEMGKLIKVYPVAVGSNRYRTPVGPRYLSNVTWNPWWYPPPSDWAKNEKPTPPGPGNPLGRVKMSLGGDIYLHATNKEYTVGTPASHGCMRMKGKDAVELAWFFQSKFSDQTDETLRPKYEARRWESFFVPLKEKIPVDVVYERVTVLEDAVVVYPDIYGRAGDLEGPVLNQLSSVGIPAWEVDPMKLEDLKRLPNSTSVPIGDLL